MSVMIDVPLQGSLTDYGGRLINPTFKRASGGMLIDDRLISYGPDEARFGDLGIVLEPANQNYLSGKIDSESEISRDDEIIIGPDGRITGDKLRESSALSNHYVSQTMAESDFSDNTRYCISAFFKWDMMRDWVMLRLNSKDGTTHTVSFNIKDGYVGVSTGAPEDKGVEGPYYESPNSFLNPGNERPWYRCWMTIDMQVGVSNITAYIFPMMSNGTTYYQGDGSSGVYIFGDQVSQGDFPGSPLPNLYNKFGNSIALDANVFGCTKTPNAVVSPDGLITGVQFTEDNSNGEHRSNNLVLSASAIGDNLDYCISFYAKPNTLSSCFIRTNNKSGSDPRVTRLNIGNGLRGTPRDHDIWGAGPEDANEWRRFWVVHNMGTGGVAPSIHLGLSYGGNISYQGDGLRNCYFWGLQVEQGTEPTGLVYTSNIKASRVSDQATIAGNGAVIEQTSGFQNAVQDNLSAIIDTGTLSSGLLYKIVTTQANHFYAGCAVNDYFYSNGTETCNASNTVQQVLYLARGVITCSLTAQFDQEPLGANIGLISCRDNSLSLLYLNASDGSIRSHDGTNLVSINPGYLAGDWLRIALRFGFLSGNDNFFEIGCSKNDSAWQWSAQQIFGGDYTPGSDFYIGLDTTRRISLNNVWFWNEPVSRSSIEGGFGKNTYENREICKRPFGLL